MEEDYELLFVLFHGEKPAVEALKDLKRREDHQELQLFNAAIVAKDEAGRTMLREEKDLDTGKGSAFGALVGGLFGLIGGPVGAVIGAAVGAAAGGLVARGMDLGFEDEFLHEIETNLKPESAVLLLLVEGRYAPTAVNALQKHPGQVARHVVRSEVIAELHKRLKE